MLAENLILLRNMKGMSQEQIAEVIGISRQSYAKWEQGTPGGCAGCFISLEKVNKDLTFKSYTRKI